ncbi:MAG: RagB/SusD family nutrient uptake outer membrane protein [Bacteroidales bacterium]|nr:RagB/SusD family nutrient uptake outer membrane protein [Bacteroidales bacterium]
MNKIILILFSVLFILVGCEDLMEPIDQNNRTLEDIYDDALFAEGLMMNAYSRIPTNAYNYFYSDVATDNAVTNDKTSSLLHMATGQWSAIMNPTEAWGSAYTAIIYLNRFLDEAEKVEWSYLSDAIDTLFYMRNIGEAYALRGYFMYHLLQAHGGYDASGNLLGVPIITEVVGETSDFWKPRNTFEECVQQIYSDLDEAEKYLPLHFARARNLSQIPAQYKAYGVNDYNRVFGKDFRLRISGQIVKAIRAKLALMAASPAYSAATTTTWENAANFAAEVLNEINGISGLDPQGSLYYTAANVDAVDLTNDAEQPEMLWRASKEGGAGSNELERQIFPPSLFGNGLINPSQNLVDAFPMANGYPISHGSGGFNPYRPYENRDPRLNRYIVVNGSQFAGSTMNLTEGVNAIDNLPTSTRTGYYLRKIVREDVSLNPAAPQTKPHYIPHIRYTEVFLIYAEAANEAWGPDGTGANSYSARSVIGAIRQRAGIAQPDNYLASIATKEEMRELIKNERRLELCFEGFRFWDLRRWKDNLTQPAMGVTIADSTYTTVQVESRLFQDHMYYPPLPYYEVLKGNLTQNSGW